MEESGRQDERAGQKAAEPSGGEGPAWHPRLGLFMSGNSHVYRLDRAGKLHVWRKRAGTNGLLFDSKGRLLACEPDRRRVTRIDPETGKLYYPYKNPLGEVRRAEVRDQADARTLIEDDSRDHPGRARRPPRRRSPNRLPWTARR